MYKRKRQIARAKNEPYFSERQCWNLDHALARIIAGGLRSFIHMERHGIPCEYVVDSADSSKSVANEKAWEADLKKMLWTFEEIANDYPSDPHSVWFDEAWRNAEAKGINPFDFDGNKLVDNLNECPESVWDDVREYRKKISEGLHLFAEHFEGLWD